MESLGKIATIVCFSFTILLLFTTKTNSATYPEIFINEFMPNPAGTDTGKEWVELYNTTDSEVNLKDWKIKTISSSGSTRITLIPEVIIQPEGFLIVVEDDSLFPDENKVSVGSGNLNMFNSGVKIELIGPSDNIVDSLTFGSGPEGKSLERPGPDIELTQCSILASHSESNTIGIENLNYLLECWSESESEEPQPLIKTLQISEVYPSPDSAKGEIEWVEIYNYGDQPVNLNGWYLKDKGTASEYGISFTYLPDLVLAQQEYIVIEELYFSLNNTGDKITLFNPEGDNIDHLEYSSIKAGESAAKEIVNGIYLTYEVNTPATTIPTPGEENIFPQVQEPELINIQDVKSKNIGDLIFTEGYITVKQGILGEDVIYIQDNQSGIKIDLQNNISTNLTDGQLIRVRGKLAQSRNELEIEIETIQDIFSDNLGAVNLNVQSNLHEEWEVYEGYLIKIEGEIIENYASSFDVLTANGVIRASILNSTGIEIEKTKGDYVHIVGVVSQYDDVYRILPRYPDDIVVLGEVQSVSTSSKTPKIAVKQRKSENKETTVQEIPGDLSNYTLPELTPKLLEYTDLTKSNDNMTSIYLWPVFLISQLIIITYVFKPYKKLDLKKLRVSLNNLIKELNKEEEYELGIRSKLT